jgi:hypothetical protein
MGELCSKFAGKNYNRQVAENPADPLKEMDDIKFELKRLKFLNFYVDFEREFPVLRHIYLTDYMNLLNSFRSDREMNPSKVNDITEEYLTKEDWMRFLEHKILGNPVITKLEISEPDKNIQRQFWDDLFDDVKSNYIMISGNNDAIEIPKSVFFAIGYLYCKDKISQKIIIMLNLFADKDDKIKLDASFYCFCFLVFTNILITPLRLFEKICGSDLEKESYFNKIKISNVLALKNMMMQLNGIRTDLANSLVDSYFKPDDKVYTKEEFKRKIMENENIWILNNNNIKDKIDEKIRDLNIEV